MKEIILTSSVLIAALCAARALFKNRVRHTLQYALWGLVALRLLVPVELGSSSLSVSSLAQRSESVAAVAQQIRQPVAGPSYDTVYQQVVQEYADQGMDVSSAPVREELEKEVSHRIVFPTWEELLTLAWAAGIAVMGVWFALSNRRFLRRAGRDAYSLDVPESPVPVRVCPNAESPCLVGLLRPAIYLPPACLEDETVLRHVLAHELTHLRHRDHWWSLVRCLCLCVHWFNPLVWVAATLSRRDCELACDEAVLKRLGDGERLAYGKTLLDVVSGSLSPAKLMQMSTAMNESKRQLTERVNYIVKKPKLYAIATVALILAVFLAAGCTFTGNDETAPEETAPAQTTETTQPEETDLSRPEETTVPIPTEPMEISMPEIDFPTEIQPLPERYTVEDLVTACYEVELMGTDQLGNAYSFAVSYPMLYPFNQFALDVQASLNGYYLTCVEEQLGYIREGMGTTYKAIRYEAYLNEDVLSLVMELSTIYEWTEYSVTHFDLKTGGALTKDDIARRFLGISYVEAIYAGTQHGLQLLRQDPKADAAVLESYENNTLAMRKLNLYPEEDGKVILVYMDPGALLNQFQVPLRIEFDMDAVTIPSRNACYDWLFERSTGGAFGTTDESYGVLLYDVLHFAPEEFLQALSRQPDKKIAELVELIACYRGGSNWLDLLLDSLGESKALTALREAIARWPIAG